MINHGTVKISRFQFNCLNSHAWHYGKCGTRQFPRSCGEEAVLVSKAPSVHLMVQSSAESFGVNQTPRHPSIAARVPESSGSLCMHEQAGSGSGNRFSLCVQEWSTPSAAL